MNRNIVIATLIVSLTFFLVMGAGLIAENIIKKPSEDNTTEFASTVKSLAVEGNGQYGIIYVEENEAELIIDFNIIDIDDFNTLQAGQTIIFRVETIWLKHFEAGEFMHIVSLRTEEEEILSLSRYNEKKDNRPYIMKQLIFLGPLFLLISIHCILLLKGINVFQKWLKLIKKR